MASANHQIPLQPQADAATAPLPHPTVLEHIQEFRSRLFWVVGFILVSSSAGYLIKDQILAVLTHPLGKQQLYYLTPIGGLSFIIKICFYFGVLVSVPLIVYHLYQYLRPLMGQQQRPVLRYFLFSFVLAICGACFAYFISLPAALHFLTDFNIDHITAMLTVDAYLTFVTSYLLGAALLFQIPLILLIIDHITPLKPGGLMKYQRHVILVAFILAAIISPTPDMINQTLLALPIIVMYQLGVIMIWFTARKRSKQQPYPQRRTPQLASAPVSLPKEPQPSPIAVAQIVAKPQPRVHRKQLISDFGRPQPKKVAAGIANMSPTLPKTTSSMRSSQPLSRTLIPERRVRIERPRPFTSIDGIIAR